MHSIVDNFVEMSKLFYRKKLKVKTLLTVKTYFECSRLLITLYFLTLATLFQFVL